MDSTIIKQLNEMIEKRVDVALVTVISKAGSGPRDEGSMMIVDASGNLLCGTVGGGGIEEHAKKDAKKCIKNNESKMIHYELTLKETESSIGMACGGDMDVFIKVFKTAEDLIIVGAGHIGLELSKFGYALGYNVTVIDHRADYANEERFPLAQRTLSGDVVEILNEIEIDNSASIVIVTHGHMFDKVSLGAVIGRDPRYIGMIGSKAKIKFCFDELKKEGITDEQLTKVFAPIGLDVGGRTPPEIALAIMAEIQAVKYQKSGVLSK